MITATLLTAALLLGYVLTVVCALASTFALTSASPAFVSHNFRITACYKRVQALIWLPCVALGAFVTCALAKVTSTYPTIAAIMFGVIAVGILWLNTWEARQRGMAHQILMTASTMLGTGIGYWIAIALIKV